jgi:hypothetical protein
VRVDDDSSEIRGEDGTCYADFFSACHLPETIGNYFACLDHLAAGKLHGAHAP